jgi:hypothetical protein
MKKTFSSYFYEITTDASFLNEKNAITPELEIELQDLPAACQDPKNNKVVNRLLELIAIHPRVPVLKNLLSVAYGVRNKFQESYDITDQILVEHPGYLFGRLNRAHECVTRKEYAKALQYLGDELEIKALYPERDVFHLSEVVSYLFCAVRWSAAAKYEYLADNRFLQLERIAPDHPQTAQAKRLLSAISVERMKEYFGLPRARRSVSPGEDIKVPLRLGIPKFNHPEVGILYDYDEAIPVDELRKLFVLPRQTLLVDIEKILQDAVDRYASYKHEQWEDLQNGQVLHAFLLLSEIGADEGLPLLLSFLKHDDKLLDFWLGDHITVTIWQQLYVLGFNNLKALEEFVLTKGISEYPRIAAADALSQIALHHPERRVEILATFQRCLHHFLELSSNNEAIEDEFLGLLINCAMQANLHELMPLIQTLYNKGCVAYTINGSYESVVKAFEEWARYDHKRVLKSMSEILHDVLNNWAVVDEGDDMDTDAIFDHEPFVSSSDKIGRNDPCPCGSGMKYKKCCMDE